MVAAIIENCLKMQTSYWFSVDERLPANSGLYLACGINQTRSKKEIKTTLYYWDADYSSWLNKDGKTALKNLNIIYWTFSDPYVWYEFDYPNSTPLLNVASLAALQEVREAIDKFNILKNLSDKDLGN